MLVKVNNTLRTLLSMQSICLRHRSISTQYASNLGGQEELDKHPTSRMMLNMFLNLFQNILAFLFLRFIFFFRCSFRMSDMITLGREKTARANRRKLRVSLSIFQQQQLRSRMSADLAQSIFTTNKENNRIVSGTHQGLKTTAGKSFNRKKYQLASRR